MIEQHPLSPSFEWADATAPARRLSDDQRRQFDDDGYVLVEDLFDLADIEALRTAIDRWETRTEDFLRTQPDGTSFIATAGAITFTVHLVERCPEARTFSRHPAMLDVCHDLIGPDVRLYWDQAVYKKPEPEREFPWHQDNGYAFVDPQQYLTCWVPLTDATVDNGCPWVMPGLHRRGTLAHRATKVGFQCLDDSSGAVPVEARVGSAVVFSSLTPHRTGPNTTSAVRKAYIVQYAPDGAAVVDAATGARRPANEPTRQYPVLVAGHPAAG